MADRAAMMQQLAEAKARSAKADSRGERYEDWSPSRSTNYLLQRGGRALANLAGGTGDAINAVANAGIRDVDYWTGGGLSGGKYDPYQFGSPSQEIADIATNVTGADIVPREEMTKGVQRAGDILETGVSSIPNGPEDLLAPTVKLAMLIGPSSKLFRHDMAKLAEEMWGAGKAAGRPEAEVLDDIWKATGTDELAGTTRSKGGFFKQELPDIGSWMKKPVSTAPDRPKTVGDALHHPRGVAAYPDVADMPIYPLGDGYPQGYRGHFDAGVPEFGTKSEIAINQHMMPEDQRSTTLHEAFGHGVSDIEGWEKGANPAQFASGPMFDPRARDLQSGFSKLLTGSLTHKPHDILQDIKYGDPEALQRVAEASGFSTLDEALEFLRAQDKKRTPLDQYRRVAGEAEARNIQTRRDMPLDQLKEKPFHRTLDVPLDEQIVLKGKRAGPSASADDGYDELARVMAAKGKNIEWFHPVGGGVKLRDKFSDLTSTTRPTGPMLPDKPMSPEDFKLDSWLLPFYGDKTIAGQTLLDVHGQPLKTPQKLGGGGRFMQENPGRVWASDRGKGTTVSGKVQKLEQASGLPVYGTHVSMGAIGGDFAKMNARTALQLTDQKAISDELAAAFDARMPETWPGIKNVDPEEWLAGAPGGDRAALVKAMQKSTFQRDPAFGNIGAIRKATTEPELMHAPMLTSGMSVGQFAPGGQMEHGAGTHDSYSTDWLGQHLGNMGQVPFKVMFPDVAAGFAAKNPAMADNLPALGYSVERQIPAQKITAKWQDDFMKWLEASRQ